MTLLVTTLVVVASHDPCVHQFRVSQYGLLRLLPVGTKLRLHCFAPLQGNVPVTGRMIGDPFAPGVQRRKHGRLNWLLGGQATDNLPTLGACQQFPFRRHSLNEEPRLGWTGF